MSGGLSPDQAIAQLRAAVAAFRERDQLALTDSARGEELRDVRCVIDSLEEEFSSSARSFQLRGGHAADGSPSAVAWLRWNCKMSSTSAADRLCVGKELESLPAVAQGPGGRRDRLSVRLPALPPARSAARPRPQ